MANREHVQLVCSSVNRWNRWRSENPAIRPDLRNADLSGQKLSGVRLNAADLFDADLSRADLTGADLAGADLTQCNLANAQVTNADLSGANVRDSVLEDIKLCKSTLTGAGFKDSNLCRADLSDVVGKGAFFYGASLEGAQLFRSNLEASLLWNANFTDANLAEAKLTGCECDDAHFQDAKLVRTSFERSNMPNARFERANLTEARFGKAHVDYCRFDGANLAGTDFGGAHISNSEFTTTNLKAARLVSATIQNSRFGGANLEGTEFGNTALVQCSLENALRLESCVHRGRSAVDPSILEQKLPLPFLRGIGLPERLIEYLPSLLDDAIQFYSCFISYSHKDEEFAKDLHAHLQDNAVRCWFAPENLRTGDEMRVAFDEAIGVRDKLLIVLSENSINSPWVKREVEQALDEERRRGQLVLFPVCLDNAIFDPRLTTGWATDIQRRHIGDFRKWKDRDFFRKAFDRLLRDLRVADSS